MVKPFCILAHSLVLDSDNFREKDWFVSRKYNGLGAFWDGGITMGKMADQIPWYHRGGDKDVPICTGLWSMGRNGKVKVRHCPASFVEFLPKGIPLQGELWYDDNLQFVNSVCKNKQPDYDLWDLVKFVPYNIKPYSLWDLPECNKPFLKNSPFYNNLGWLEMFKLFLAKAEVKAKSMEIPTFTQLHNDQGKRIKEFHSMIEYAREHKWEGLVLQNADAKYECKRSNDTLKWLPYYDGEATVIYYEKGKSGKNLGRWGSIVAEMTWGDEILSIHGGDGKFIDKTVVFHIGGLNDTENESVERYYPIGSTIPFIFKNISIYGIPQSANIKREVL